MTRRFRTFLLCLLMAALPLQGLAAVLKASCGPAHHKQVVLSAHSDHGTGLAHDAHHGHAAQSQHLDQQDVSADAVSGSNAFCSACAVCSASAVALPAAATPGCADFVSSPALQTPAPLLASVVPAGLERPPKTASI